MKAAPLAPNELERLKCLLEYAVLDTPSELEYDDITLLASTICNTPISLISLIDKDRQWFKSKVGLGVSETSRNISFCGHAIHCREVFVVPDSFIDQRFADNPLVTGAPKVRFYAGAPLITPSGYAVGTLCVIDHQPRELSQEQIKALQALARQVVCQLELRKSYEAIKNNLSELQNFTKIISDQQCTLINSAKMAALGEMAGGIAHEINNPLAIISGKISQVRRRFQKGTGKIDEALIEMDTVEKTVHRIAKIVKALRVFARDGSKDLVQKSKLDDIITDCVSLVSERFKAHGVKLILPPLSELIVSCRPVEISQVLLNLLNNSLDAILNQSDKWVKIEVRNTDTVAHISVIDSGTGVPIEIREKIMEPFFTTKAVGKGTGLGLSIAKGLIESNNGKLFLDHNQSNTTFVIHLPLSIPSSNKVNSAA